MWSVLDCFSKEQRISSVVICIPDWRLDNQTIQTIQYYAKLFKPIFDVGNVIIARTKVGPENYEEMVEMDSIQETQDKFLNELKSYLPECGNVSFVQMINSKITSSTREKLILYMSMIDNGQAVPADDIYVHSLFGRFNVINYIKSCGSVSTINHQFPLPPVVDMKRRSELDALKRVQNKEIETTKKYNADHAKLLEELRDSEMSCALVTTTLQSLISTLHQMQSPVVVDKKTLSGSEWVYLLSNTTKLSSTTKFSIPVNKWKVHNCDANIVETTPTNVTVKVKPFTFLLFREWKNNLSWFAEIWLECDGNDVNHDAIQQLQIQIAEKQTEMTAKNTVKVCTTSCGSKD
jgi:hypothetical protein